MGRMGRRVKEMGESKIKTPTFQEGELKKKQRECSRVREKVVDRKCQVFNQGERGKGPKT